MLLVRFLHRVVSVSDTPAPAHYTSARDDFWEISRDYVYVRTMASASARALDLDLQMIRRRSVGLSIKPFTAAAEAQRPTKNIDKVFSLFSLPRLL